MNQFLAMDLSATSLAAVGDVSQMARECYGYGCWNVPYWFIGPEQGQAPQENDDLTLRLKAWTQLGRGELNDCRDFHNQKHQRSPSGLKLRVLAMPSRLSYQYIAQIKSQ